MLFFFWLWCQIVQIVHREPVLSPRTALDPTSPADPNQNLDEDEDFEKWSL